jgi:ATP-binding protein involved in chromosome partitioning
MAEKTNQKIIGVVENMAWFSCPRCGEPTEIFGRGGAEALAERLGVEVIGRIPLAPQVREGGDEGKPVTVTDPESSAAKAFGEIASKLAALRPPGSRQ